jgi:hypothetical protein
MDQRASNLDDKYRLIFLEAESRTILLVPNGAKRSLPHVAIPHASRAARELQLSIKDKWQVDAIILDFVPSAKGDRTAVVVEIASSAHYENLIPAHIDDIQEDELDSESRALAESVLSGASASDGPFSRLGWINEALQWLSMDVDPKLPGGTDVRQYNAGSTFALVHFDTHQGPSYWLKATGYPNEHESRLTQMLASHFGDYLPRVLAQRPAWNAWVTEDSGQPLADIATYSAYRQTIASLGCLQGASTNHIGTLLVSGCADLRTRALAGQIWGLFTYLEEAMERQTSTKSTPLSSYRLRELARIVEDTCSKVDALGMPDALIHNDINLSNVLVNGPCSVFIDWAEGAVGNPFLTFEHLRVQILRDRSTAGWMPSLEQLYRRQWADILSDSKIAQGLILSRMLAIVAHLIGRGTWLSSEMRPSPMFEAHARSLAREMDRVARSNSFLEVLCR